MLLIIYQDPIKNISRLLDIDFNQQEFIRKELAKIPANYLADSIFDQLRKSIKNYDSALSFITNAEKFLLNPPNYPKINTSQIKKQVNNFALPAFVESEQATLNEYYSSLSLFCEKNNELVEYIENNKTTFTAAKKAIHFEYLKAYEESKYYFLVNSFKAYYEACIDDPKKSSADCKIQKISNCK